MHGGPFSFTNWSRDTRDVHVWHVALDDVDPSLEMRSACLSDDERTRSTLYTAPLERRRFIASRIVLRHILAGYHGVSPTALNLAREPGGRPYIEGADRLFFSLSHSRGTALVAVAAVPVGVDVERMRRVGRAGAIALRILHPDTVALLGALPPQHRNRAFIDAWLQREAHVKAVGGGLFRTGDVLPFDPRQRADASVRPVIARDDGSLWSTARFRPAPAVRAAVVTPGLVDRILPIDWNTVADSLLEEDR